MEPGVTDDAAGGWDLIEGDDVIGTASARLLSTCTDRGERLAALSLLGLLLDHADEAGRVRLPLGALARELEVEPDRAVRLLQQLVAVEAVHAQGDAVVVAGAVAAKSEFAPSRFLANLITVLEREPASSAPGGAGSTGASNEASARHQAPKHRILIALGVAVAAVALATAPSGDPATSLRTVAAPSVSSGRAPWATVPAPEPSPAPPGVATGENGPVRADNPSFSEDVPPDRSPRPEGQDQTSEVTKPPLGPLEPPRSQDASPTPSRNEPSGVDPQRPLDRPGLLPLPPSPPVAPALPEPPPAPPDQGEGCPSGAPVAAVASTELVGAGPSNVLDLVGERMLLVRGTVVNSSDTGVTVTTVEIRAGAAINPTIALVSPVPIAIPPGGTALWEATLLARPATQLLDLVGASVTEWTWSEPDLALSCPS